jgi:hypothetical protein
MWSRRCARGGGWKVFGWTWWDVESGMRRSGRWAEDTITCGRGSEGADERKIVGYMDDTTGEVYTVCFVSCLQGAYMITDSGEGYVVAGAGVWFCECVHLLVEVAGK